MNQIYLTGDCHGDYNRFSFLQFPKGKSLTRDDYIIVLGDFGYWSRSREQEYWRAWLSEKPFTVLFVDGNHENFDMLNALPVEDWNGGKVHRVSENILHLMRGQVFEFAGKSWFTMGGAQSHDIDDGILDPNAPDFAERYVRLRRRHGMFRILRESWWPEEMPSKEELQAAEQALAARGNKVDFILTHEAPYSSVHRFSNGRYETNELSVWFDKIKAQTQFEAWFHGHHHINYRSENVVGLYRKIIKLEQALE